MAFIKVDRNSVREFKDAESFYKWLGRRHDKSAEIWFFQRSVTKAEIG